jgi:hypothetical protein
MGPHAVCYRWDLERKLAGAQPTGRHHLSIAFSADRRIRLLLWGTGVIHVVIAVITARGDLR